MKGNDLIQIILKLIRLYQKYSRNKNYRRLRKADYNSAYKGKARNVSEIIIDQLPEAKLVHISDGDGFVAMVNRVKTTIRMDSIDAPELNQPYGDTAKQALSAFIEGRSIHLEIHGIDDFGRTLATVYVWNNFDKDWLNVNEQLVLLGHVWVMQKFYDHLPRDRQRRLENFQISAQSKNMGLWNTPDPIPPWKWKNHRRI